MSIRNPSVDESNLDPELDLLDRYDQMIQTQIETINGIDDKAAYTGRLIAILGGLVLTAASVAVSTDAIEFSETTAGVFLIRSFFFEANARAHIASFL